MTARLRRSIVAASMLVVAACRMNPGINPKVEQDELQPPVPVSGGGPALVGATPQRPVAIEILVQVDTLGRADLSTLQLTGQGVEANRQVIRDWLSSARFQPARLNGYLVRGWFRVAAEAKAAGVRDY
jgi:hypothetical protein